MDPWGGETQRSSNQNLQPHRYATYERDANGSDYAQARQYHGYQMRFDQPDPYDGSYDLTDPQSFNRYSYVQNDPVNFIDPTGLCLWVPLDLGESGTRWVPVLCNDYRALPQPEVGPEPPVSGGVEPPQTQPGTVNDLLTSIYGDDKLLKKINDCLKQLLGANFSKFGEQTLANAPKVDVSLTSEQIAPTLQMSAPPYAVGAGHIGGQYGTIFIGSQWFSNPTDWTVNGRGGQPGRTPLQNAYVHELGNLASYRASGGTTYGLFGVKGASDEDSGYQLQKCVFGN